MIVFRGKEQVDLLKKWKAVTTTAFH